jgi:hypothetical protein
MHFPTVNVTSPSWVKRHQYEVCALCSAQGTCWLMLVMTCGWVTLAGTCTPPDTTNFPQCYLHSGPSGMPTANSAELLKEFPASYRHWSVTIVLPTDCIYSMFYSVPVAFMFTIILLSSLRFPTFLLYFLPCYKLKKINSVEWVRVQTIPTERQQLVSEVSANFLADRGCHVVIVTDPYGSVLGLLDRSRYFIFQVAPQLYSRGWVDPIPDQLLLRKYGSAGNRTRTSGSVARNSDH